jgi:hypothetical protein
MGHFAQIENGIVQRVIVVANEAMDNLEFPESEPLGLQVLADSGFEGTWKQTSINANFRGKYANQGFTYDEVNDVFVAPVAEEVTDGL